MASANDLFQKLGSSSSLVNTPKVTATRSGGGTTLTVDNCNWDTSTGKIFATYQVDTSNNVIANTQIMWKGVVNSTTSIGNLTRLAGASDAGNAIGDYVELLPASLWGDNMVTGILTEHNQDGTHGNINPTSVTSSGNIQTSGSIVADTVSEKTVGAGVTAGGVLLKSGLVQQLGAVQQVVFTETGAEASGTTVVPYDDTIPQNTEGDQYMSLAVTPKASTNILVIEVTVMAASSVTSNNLIAALFQDSTASALAASVTPFNATNSTLTHSFKHTMVSGTTSATTFKVRAGGNTAGTVTFNGFSAARKFGGSLASSIIITEYKAS